MYSGGERVRKVTKQKYKYAKLWYSSASKKVRKYLKYIKIYIYAYM